METAQRRDWQQKEGTSQLICLPKTTLSARYIYFHPNSHSLFVCLFAGFNFQGIKLIFISLSRFLTKRIFSSHVFTWRVLTFKEYLPERINQNQITSPGVNQNCIATAPSSVYPCTSIVNPTIVLLQHNRGEQTSWTKCLQHFTTALRARTPPCLCLWSAGLVLLRVAPSKPLHHRSATAAAAHRPAPVSVSLTAEQQKHLTHIEGTILGVWTMSGDRVCLPRCSVRSCACMTASTVPSAIRHFCFCLFLRCRRVERVFLTFLFC